MPEFKKMGFVSIINLRLATEPGAEVEKEEAAAKAVGLRYFHAVRRISRSQSCRSLPNAITSPGAEPAFIHCGGGNRAATMWLIKRLAVDRWDVDRAVQEATALGQTSAPLRKFAIDTRSRAHDKTGGSRAYVGHPRGELTVPAPPEVLRPSESSEFAYVVRVIDGTIVHSWLAYGNAFDPA